MPEDVKRLYRSRTDRWLTGVAGGLAEYFGIDAILIRVLWIVALIFTFGAALLVYVILWLMTPERPLGQSPPSLPAKP